MTPAGPQALRVTGTGFTLAGPDGACTSTETFWDIVSNGRCCLSAYEVPGLPLRIAGHLRGWDVVGELGLDERMRGWASRAGLLALGAVHGALTEAGLEPGDLDDGRTVIVLTSVQFSQPEVGEHVATLADQGPAGLRMAYFMNGTVPSVLSTVCAGLDIQCPTLTTSGSCNTAARALEVADMMFRAGDIDRAVVVGVDVCHSPVFVASTLFRSRRGFQATSLTDDPLVIRPHDQEQDGNATGEGAVAVVLERADRTGTAAGPAVRLWFDTSRRHGPSPMTTGDGAKVAAGVERMLAAAGTSADRLAFVSTYADGQRFVEDHVCEALEAIRTRLDHRGPLLLTNQEAAFGHIGGTGGMIKFASSVLMLRHGMVGPVVNCRRPYARLAASVPVIGRAVPTSGTAALVLAGGSGGDTTTLLVDHLPGR